MSSTCQIVLLACLSTLASGCYLLHGREGEPAPEHDAGMPTARDASFPERDASAPALDASLPPPMCPAQRADFTCLESFQVTPGRPFSLPFAFDGCACCAQTECRVAVDRAGRTLAIDTTLCPDPCDCDACNVPTGACEVPALDEGEWTVVANGAPAFVLPIHPDSGFAPPPPACARYAEVDDTRCGPTDPVPGRVLAGDLCIETSPRPNRLDVIRVHSFCWPCGDLRGACVARLEPRYTDDLPPGGELRLEPTTYSTACDVDCPAVCVEYDEECIVPPLTDGDTYRVWLGDRVLATFVAGEPTSSCFVLHDAL